MKTIGFSPLILTGNYRMKTIGFSPLILILVEIVYVQGMDRSARFDKILLDGPQVVSLQNNLHLETRSSSVMQCAAQCLESKDCLSVIRNKMSGTCSMFRSGVDLGSGNIFGSFAAYTKRVICEDIGYISLTSTKTCMKRHDVPLPWTDANTTCHADGGHLISITTPNMLEEVLNLTSRIDSSYSLFFVDGNDVSQEGQWVHYDGSATAFQFWALGEPAGGLYENCRAVINEKCHDVPCNGFPQKYVCERHIV